MKKPNEAYAEYVKWRDLNVDYHGFREFIVMWSDFTWSSFKVPNTEYWLTRNGVTKTYKQVMRLNNIVSEKMTKLQAEAYINKRIEELESYN